MGVADTGQARKPIPEVTAVSAPFWEAAAGHRLVIQRCTGCGRWQFIPLVVCPACSGELEWAEASGRATLHTFTIVHQLYHPAFKDDLPYNVAVVELEEGPHMVTNVVGVENDALEIGMPLQVVFDDIEHGISLPKFEPRHV